MCTLFCTNSALSGTPNTALIVVTIIPWNHALARSRIFTTYVFLLNVPKPTIMFIPTRIETIAPIVKIFCASIDASTDATIATIAYARIITLIGALIHLVVGMSSFNIANRLFVIGLH